jgi:hypothetical protein
MEKYFLTQVKRTNGTFEKGCVVKDTLDEVRQSYHAYLGAYAYGHDAKTDYVQCLVTDINGMVILAETWNGIQEDEE